MKSEELMIHIEKAVNQHKQLKDSLTQKLTTLSAFSLEDIISREKNKILEKLKIQLNDCYQSVLTVLKRQKDNIEHLIGERVEIYYRNLNSAEKILLEKIKEETQKLKNRLETTLSHSNQPPTLSSLYRLYETLKYSSFESEFDHLSIKMDDYLNYNLSKKEFWKDLMTVEIIENSDDMSFFELIDHSETKGNSEGYFDKSRMKNGTLDDHECCLPSLDKPMNIKNNSDFRRNPSQDPLSSFELQKTIARRSKDPESFLKDSSPQPLKLSNNDSKTQESLLGLPLDNLINSSYEDLLSVSSKRAPVELFRRVETVRSVKRRFSKEQLSTSLTYNRSSALNRISNKMLRVRDLNRRDDLNEYNSVIKLTNTSKFRRNDRGKIEQGSIRVKRERKS